ncbi:MAG TPA: hypothetical protein VF622_15790 [Segetibacter sp.]|jgi:hypothetical protein
MLSFVLRRVNKYLASRADRSVRQDFYYSKIYFKRITIFYNIFTAKKKDALISTTSESINPLGLKFGITYKQAVKQFNKPSFVYDNEKKDKNHKAVLIRHSINNIKLLVQLQFFNDKLFFIGLDVSRSINKEEEKSQVINTVIQKYLNKPFKTGDEYPIIEDQAGNFIIINDDINFSICYLDGNMPHVRKYIMEHAQSSLKQPSKDKESLFYAF